LFNEYRQVFDSFCDVIALAVPRAWLMSFVTPIFEFHCTATETFISVCKDLSMNIVVSVSSELRRWMLHNLERGCAANDLIDSMVKERFEPRIARALIDVFVRARSTGTVPPEGALALELQDAEYRYETPRLAPGNRIETAERRIDVLMRVEQPRMAVLGHVMSGEECAALIELARHRLRPSTVVDPKTGADRIVDHRNSESMFFMLEETPLVRALDRRFAQIMQAPVEHGEGLQVVRYGPGAQTAPHFDFLVPSNPANEASIARSGQRIATLVVYLNDVLEGGETVFPEVGLAVSPQQGNAVYFEYSNSLRQLDHKSVHAGAAVVQGDKWIVTKWIREQRFVPAPGG